MIDYVFWVFALFAIVNIVLGIRYDKEIKESAKDKHYIQYVLDGKLGRLAKTFQAFGARHAGAGITTGSVAALPLRDGTIDYIFTDPPFGENIYYADLNFLVESWHRVTTDAKPEAIVDRFKKKGLPEFQHLMQRCFAEYYRVLKPGRWMTVVFSNSKAAVWNAIQVALQQAGFVVAEVTLWADRTASSSIKQSQPTLGT